MVLINNRTQGDDIKKLPQFTDEELQYTHEHGVSLAFRGWWE